jgi:hypothetical protein
VGSGVSLPELEARIFQLLAVRLYTSYFMAPCLNLPTYAMRIKMSNLEFFDNIK